MVASTPGTVTKPTPALSSNCGGDVIELQGTGGPGLGGTEGAVEGTDMGMATKVKGDAVEQAAVLSKPSPQTHDGEDEMVVAPTTSTASITEVPDVGHDFMNDGRKEAESDEVERRVDRPPPPSSQQVPTAPSARDDAPRRPNVTPASPSADARRASEERRRAFALRRKESPVHSGLWRAHEAGIATGGTVLSESFLRRRHAVGVGVGVVANTAGQRGRVIPPEPQPRPEQAAAAPSTSPPRVVASPPAQVVVGGRTTNRRAGVNNNNNIGGSRIYDYSTDLTSSLHSSGSLSGSSGRFYHVVALGRARPVRSDSRSGGVKLIRGTSFGSSVVSSLTNSVGLFGSSSSFLSSSLSLSSFNNNSVSMSNHSASVPSSGGGSSSSRATTVHSLCSSLSTFDSARVRDPFKDSLRPRGGGAAAAVARRRHRPRLVPGPRRPPLRALADSTSSDLGFDVDVDADASVDGFEIDDDRDGGRDLSAESSSRRVPPPSASSSSYSASASASTSGNHTLLHGWLPPPLVPRSAFGSGTDTTARLEGDTGTEIEKAVPGSGSGSASVAPPPHPPRPSWMPSPLAAVAADTPLRYYTCPSNLSTGGAHRLRRIAAVATRMRIRMASSTSWYSGEGVEAATVVGEEEGATSAVDDAEFKSSKEEGGGAVDGFLGPSATAGPTVIVTPEGGVRDSDDDVARDQAGADGGVAEFKLVDGGEGGVAEDTVVNDDDDDEAIFVIALPRSVSWSADQSSSSSSSEVIEARDVVADGPSLAWVAAASMKRCLSHDDVELLFLDSTTTLTHGSEDRSSPPSRTSSSASGSTDTDDAEECFGSSIIATATEEGRDDSGSAGRGSGKGGTEPEGGGHLRPSMVHDSLGAQGAEGHASTADERDRERAILEYYYGRSPSSLSSVLSFQILGTSASDPSTHPHVLSPPLMESLQSFLPPSVVAEGEPSNFWLRYSLVRDGSSLQTLLNNIRGARHTILALETVGGEVIGSFTGSPWKRTGARFYGTGEAFLWRLRRPRTDTGDTRTDTSTGDAGANNSVIDQARLESELDVYPWTGRNGYVQLCTGDKIALGGGRLLTTTIHGAEEEESSTVVDHHDASKGGDAVDFCDECGGEGGGFGLILDGDLLYGASSPCATFGNPSLTGCGKAGGGQFEILNVEVWSLTPFASIEEAETMEAAAIFVEENRV